MVFHLTKQLTHYMHLLIVKHQFLTRMCYDNNRPLFIGVSDILKISTDNTVDLLKEELLIKLGELENQWHYSSLERIFIENKIYRDIENQDTWNGVLKAIDLGLRPYTEILKRDVVEEDIVRLTEIKIKRISKFDIDKASDKIIDLENQIKQVKFNLDDIVNFSINYFKNLKKDYSENRERKTEIKLFDDVDATKVVIRNTKLYINREEGFIGTSLRKDEYVCDCSDIDDLIVFTKDCKVVITKVDSKTFIGKNIIHAAVFKKKDKRTIYNMIYKDGDKNFYYLKRFAVSGVTRDKVYNLSSAKKQSIVSYFSANPNGEAEIVSVILRQSTKLKKFKWDVNFSDYIIKGRSSRGNIVTKHSVNKIELKEKGVSTLKPRKIWFDDSVQRLNVDGRGELLGEFSGEDKLLIIRQNGMLKTISPEITTRFSEDMIVLEKWLPKKPISAVYFDGKKEKYFLKRFLIENENKEETFISLNKNTFLEIVCTDWKPVIELVYNKERNKEQRSNTSIDIEEFISIKGIKAQGNQLTGYKVKQINILESKEYVPPIEVSANEIEVIDENEIIEEVKDPSENDTDSGQTTLF